MDLNINQTLPQEFNNKITLTPSITYKSTATLNLIVLGMAGSGKTTFVQKLEEVIDNKEQASYIINTDPAVFNTKYEANLDIRDTINYKQIMQVNNLGPNGAIITCLNLFSTSINKVVSILEQKQDVDYVVVDTPGQLEVFSWSASGKLISDALAVTFPTVLIYVVDIPRCKNPNTFASNMLYAISIMYKMRLPLVIVFNKKDIESEDNVFKWIKEYDLLQEALKNGNDYISSFSSSLAIVLEEFYKTIKYVAVSSTSGDGFDEVLKVCNEIKDNYIKEKELNE
jgi:GTPase SAR1 family protein